MAPGLSFYESSIKIPGGTLLGVRSTLVSLKNNHNILISPIKFNPEQLRSLTALAPTAIVAPNCHHHLYAKGAAERLSIKTMYAAPGLEKKRSDVPWTSILSEQTWPHMDELPMIHMRGIPAFNECVFFHKESKTLIVQDLLFNIKGLKPGLSTLVFRLMGTYNRLACSRLLKLLVKDRIAFQKDLARILEYDFDRVVMAHGEIVHANGKQLLTAALFERGLLQ